MVWTLDDRADPGAPLRTTRTEWVGGVERYNALRRDGTTRMLQAVTLKANRFVAPQLYLTGQAHSGYAGGAGGYTVGLVGVGAQTPLFGRFHAGAEALVGAAGGGGVQTHGGAIAQPNAYVGMDLGHSMSLRIGAGRIQSLKKGGLAANVIDAALAFTFGVPEHAPR
jgi:hypothetical protein